MSQEFPNSEALPLIKGLKLMIQSDKNGIDILCGISHIVNSNVMPAKSCVEALGYTQPPTEVNHSIPLTIPMASVPTFTSSIMATSKQNVIPTINGANSSYSFNPMPSLMPSMSTPIFSQQMSVTQGGNLFNHFTPPCSNSFPTQSSPIPNYHSVPPPYYQ